MHFLLDDLQPAQRYKLLASTIVPRPIAWITTRSAAGVVNAAPYSFFNMLSSAPPLIAVGIGADATKPLKDTAANIEANGEFVVNLVDEPVAQAMSASSAAFDAGISEPEALGLALAPMPSSAVPRIAQSPVGLACRIYRNIALSERQRIILGEVVGLHVDDRLVKDPERLHLDLKAYAPLGRMGGRTQYCRTHDHIDIERPD